ncbi:MAG: hypothetical protein KA369_22150 [Spirochaetes bacterium]|nr:hypothetical protein [Spirochaetota bacterium]
MQEKTDKQALSGFSLIRKVSAIDNPILRHFIKKHKLDDRDSLLLGVLLDLTDQMKTPIKTTYRAIADTTELTTMQVYRSIGSLHRNRIIEYKPSGDYVHISFRDIDESIEEITLAYENAKKIKKIEEYLAFIRAQKYVPSAELYDLMYPLVGRLVMAKVAEAFRSLVNYINARLESSFSIAMWKYRITSFRTGIPLAEIVLRESLPYYIDEIFLLQKRSSILLGHVSRDDERSVDKDLVGGMLGAINDFIKTSFKKSKSGVGEIQFDEYRIMIFESMYFYAAVVLYGSPDMDFLHRVDAVLNGIHQAYSRRLKNFDGDMAKLQGIDAQLRDLVDATNTSGGSGEKASLARVKAAGALLAMFAVAGVVWLGYTSYRDRRLEGRISHRVNQALPPYSHDVDIDVSGDTASVTGTVSSRQAGDAISREIRAFKEISQVRNRTVTADFRSVEAYKKDLDEMRSRLESFQLVAARQELEKIVVQFPAGVSAMDNPQTLQVRRAYEILKQYPRVHADIVAFNDPAGGYDVNKALAEKRMRSVRDSLAAMGIAGERLHLVDFDPDILTSDSRYTEFSDRRGIMMFARYPD